MNTPTMEYTGNRFKFSWSEGIQITVSHLREHGDSVTGEIDIETNLPGYNPHLECGNLNISSIAARFALAKQLNELCGEIDWQTALGQMARIVLDKLRDGEPTCELWSNADWQPPEYLLHPILPKHEETVIFGPRESGKSWLALMISICSQLPWKDNPYGFETLEAPANVLYLDWETNKDATGWRLGSLVRGLGLPELPLQYRRMYWPLEDILEQVQEAVQEHDIGLLIIDSVGKACAGDLNTADTALRFFRALRQLNVTKLLIAHTSKDNEKRNTIFGSGYFENDPRYIWEIRKQQKTGEDEIKVGMFHHKSNISKRFPPIGLKMTFDGHKTTICREDVGNVPELAVRLGAKHHVMAYLKKHGVGTVNSISEGTGIPQNTVRKALERGQKGPKKWSFRLGKHDWRLFEY